MALSIGNWLKIKFPDFKPMRMLDMGTCSGKNLLPYIDIFPGLEAFGIDVAARYFVSLGSADDFEALRAEPLYTAHRRLVLGGGSNVLFTRDFDGLILHNRMPGFEMTREDESCVWVRAGAGQVWDEFVERCIERGWAGLENLSLIPGQVGSAPLQNIGAYGVEIESRCELVEAIHLETEKWWAHYCRYSERDQISFPVVFPKEEVHFIESSVWRHPYFKYRNHKTL